MDLVGAFQAALRAAFGPDAAVYALAAIGLNVQFGLTGLSNFGQVGFMLLGAYGVGVIVSTAGLSMWLGVVVAILLCTAFAVMLGIPTLRLRADYFAITTIAAAEILRFIARSSSAEDLTGGPFGLQDDLGRFLELSPFDNSETYGIARWTYSGGQLWTMLVTWSLVALATLLVAHLVSAPWGRVVRSIREDEDVASSLGKNVLGYKLQALVIGGILGGLAGVMLALGNATVNANTFQPEVTFFLYVALIMGGAATLGGPIVGSILFWFLFVGSQALMVQLEAEGYLPGFLEGSQARGAAAAALMGILLMVMMAFRPQGIFGKRAELAFSA